MNVLLPVRPLALPCDFLPDAFPFIGKEALGGSGSSLVPVPLKFLDLTEEPATEWFIFLVELAWEAIPRELPMPIELRYYSAAD